MPSLSAFTNRFGCRLLTFESLSSSLKFKIKPSLLDPNLGIESCNIWQYPSENVGTCAQGSRRRPAGLWSSSRWPSAFAAAAMSVSSTCFTNVSFPAFFLGSHFFYRQWLRSFVFYYQFRLLCQFYPRSLVAATTGVHQTVIGISSINDAKSKLICPSGGRCGCSQEAAFDLVI
jgi:hypothetical protein